MVSRIRGVRVIPERPQTADLARAADVAAVAAEIATFPDVYAPKVASRAVLTEYASLVNVDGYWDAAMIQAQADAYEVYVPEGRYKIKEWIPGLSHRHWRGDGKVSVIANDNTNADSQRRSTFLPGLHHPALMAAQTSYSLAAIVAGDYGATLTTAGDAANFAVGDLVIVGSATNSGGVPRHAQLNKVQAISGGDMTFVDPIERAIPDALIWTITGTDASSGYPVHAIEDFHLNNLGLEGRSGIATKGALFGGSFSHLYMLDVHNAFATNMMTNVTIDGLFGEFSGRMLEFAFNSYNVTVRNAPLRFRTPSALNAGAVPLLPIHLGEQPYKVLLEDVTCYIDERFTASDGLVQAKGSELTFRRCGFRHTGTTGTASAIAVPDSSFTDHPYENITFDLCTLAAPGRHRIAEVGSATFSSVSPRGVHFRGGELRGSVLSQSIWFRGGGGHSCSVTDRTGSTITVGTACQYPTLAGYRRTA